MHENALENSKKIFDSLKEFYEHFTALLEMQDISYRYISERENEISRLKEEKNVLKSISYRDINKFSLEIIQIQASIQEAEKIVHKRNLYLSKLYFMLNELKDNIKLIYDCLYKEKSEEEKNKGLLILKSTEKVKKCTSVKKNAILKISDTENFEYFNKALKKVQTLNIKAVKGTLEFLDSSLDAKNFCVNYDAIFSFLNTVMIKISMIVSTSLDD